MKVAVAIITDERDRILITQRSYHIPHGGFWEFPGGKLEANERAEQALIREIREEVGLEINKFQLLGEITHQYPDKSVQLIVFQVTEFSGKPSCLERQLNIKWMEKEKLNPEDFPEANKGIFDLISIELAPLATDDCISSSV
ncbi:7,8-dihydro-8-oxoguanine-triphosphatase [Legionella antarctica]|uniref:8-oxo-dGTP diphosphatase n=1 Tax=Legionella antarctica TaxID=2708020 RepID=A0A6F8T567_9GAMM|nr:8-oxo-dGTP diphosphatase MutT [Legionella antarctica]BCA95601.1 7,8-dihydro-8-oxoguanine-triphosphatase [Legionella antarctica]